MSKVNRRQEIKEKEAFQAKFQLALKQQSLRVLSWLTLSEDNQTSSSVPQLKHESSASSDRNKFLELPILSNGSGLSELENDEKNGSIATIGSFIQDSSSSQALRPITAGEKKGQPASKAMASLMNRVRGDTRKQIHEREREQGKLRRFENKNDRGSNRNGKKQKTLAASSTGNESDEEELKLAQMLKKVQKPMGKKGKARPF